MDYKSKFLEWVLPEYEAPSEDDLRKIVPNIEETFI
jgi:hypothetical protein